MAECPRVAAKLDRRGLAVVPVVRCAISRARPRSSRPVGDRGRAPRRISMLTDSKARLSSCARVRRSVTRSTSIGTIAHGRARSRERDLPQRRDGLAKPRRHRDARATTSSSRDAGSLNGTYVNGECVDDARPARRRRASGRRVPDGLHVAGRCRLMAPRDYMTIGEVVERLSGSLSGPHDLEGPLPRGGGPDLSRANAGGLSQVLTGRSWRASR